MKCQKCNSKRIAGIGAKCSDLSSFYFDDLEYNGYVLENVGIGGGDYVEFDYCLDCGQIQGEFPIKLDIKYCPECNKQVVIDKNNFDDNYAECNYCDFGGSLDDFLDKPKSQEDMLAEEDI